MLLCALDGTWGQVKSMAREFSRAGVPLVHVSESATVSVLEDRRQVELSRVTTCEAIALALNELGEPDAAKALFGALSDSAAAYQRHLARTASPTVLAAKQAHRARERASMEQRSKKTRRKPSRDGVASG